MPANFNKTLFAFVLASLLLFHKAGKAQTIKPIISLGVTNYSYFSENLLQTNLENSFFKSVITAPTIGLRLESKKYHFGLETNYYQASVTNSLPEQALLYGKLYYDAGVYGIYKNLRVSLFYAHLNFRNYTNFGFGSQLRLAYEESIGAAISYNFYDYELGLRMERVWEIRRGELVNLRRFSPVVEILTLKLQRNFSVLPSKENLEQKASKDNLFNIQFGLFFTGNGLHGRVGSMPLMKVAPTLGVEFKLFDYGLYLRRSVWQNVDVFYPDAGKYSSVYNQIGFSYFFDLPKIGGLEVGIHHLWNYTRGQQHFALQQGAELSNDIVPFIPQNKGLGLHLEYQINEHLDFGLDLDAYYKAYPDLGTGINKESIRFGLLYNLR